MLLIRPRIAVRPAYAVATFLLVVYAWYSIWRHHSFQSTGYDLGIFEQAVRSYAQGRWPSSDLKGPGFPLLGDHFHPILAVLAPFYLLVPRAETLLVAQALLFAVSAVPLTRLAVERLGSGRGLAVGLAYGFSWGLQNAVAFDFHEICFAVPLLAFSLEALAREQWRTAALWALPLVLVKEDLPITVAAIGLYLLHRRQRWLGLALTAFGVLSFVVIVFVVLPAFNPAGDYAYWANLRTDDNVFGIVIRIGTVAALLAPTGFLAVRSPLLLVALPTLGWRFASGNPAYWGIGYHYSAVLMPIAFIAFVAVGPRLTHVRVCVAVTVLFALLLPLRPPTQPEWNERERAEAAEILSMVPDGAEVAASNRIAPHLTGRCRVSLFPLDREAEWLVVARPSPGWPVPAEKEAQYLAETRHEVVAETSHLGLLRRTDQL